jgi:dephospho-CoA kinase
VAALNGITHPAISTVMLARRDAEKETDHVVVLDIPLLKPVHRELLALELVIVVDTPVELALDRLVEQRGFSRQDAEARMAAQPGRAERREGADVVIDNSSDPAHLVGQVDRLWEDLEARRH